MSPHSHVSSRSRNRLSHAVADKARFRRTVAGAAGTSARARRAQRRQFVLESLEDRRLLARSGEELASLLARDGAASGLAVAPPDANFSTYLAAQFSGELVSGELVSGELVSAEDSFVGVRANDGAARLSLASFAVDRLSTTTRELVILDVATPNYQQLANDILASAHGSRRFAIAQIDSNEDGVVAIGRILSRYSNLDAVHIVSHGRSGAMQLGNVELSAANVDDYRDSIRGWSESLATDADLLFYGCELAAGDEGAKFVETLAELTGADVAASVDVTGNSALGGDWVLEQTTGPIESNVPFSFETQADWFGSLETFSQTNTVVLNQQLQDGSLVLEPITAYNLVVDSNAGTPASYGPKAAHFGVIL